MTEDRLGGLGGPLTVQPNSGGADPGLATVHRFGGTGQWIIIRAWRGKAQMGVYADTAERLTEVIATMSALGVVDDPAALELRQFGSAP